VGWPRLHARSWAFRYSPRGDGITSSLLGRAVDSLLDYRAATETWLDSGVPSIDYQFRTRGVG